MGFVEAVKSVLANWKNFSGRARRSEYWFWVLAVSLGYVAIVILAAIFAAISENLAFLGIILYCLYGLAIIVPSLAVTVRRLQDTDHDWWWILINLIPFGGLVVLYFTILEGTPGDNRFGSNPKA